MVWYVWYVMVRYGTVGYGMVWYGIYVGTYVWTHFMRFEPGMSEDFCLCLPKKNHSCRTKRGSTSPIGLAFRLLLMVSTCSGKTMNASSVHQRSASKSMAAAQSIGHHGRNAAPSTTRITAGSESQGVLKIHHATSIRYFCCPKLKCNN